MSRRADETRRRGAAITRRLLKLYPHPHLELEYASPLELLVALILAAQCTDERVNAAGQRRHP